MINPFFAGLSDPSADYTKRPYLKFSTSTKESLVKAKDFIETRLREDYKKVFYNIIY